MNLTPIFHGVVSEGGILVLESSERLLRHGYLKRLIGKPVDVMVRLHRYKRSDRQNAWHWGVAVPLIAHHLGYDKHEHEDVHYALVAKCFGVRFDPLLKQEIPNVRSSQLTTMQFSELMEWEVRWAAQEHGLQIPLPNEAAVAA